MGLSQDIGAELETPVVVPDFDRHQLATGFEKLVVALFAVSFRDRGYAVHLKVLLQQLTATDVARKCAGARMSGAQFDRGDW